MKKTLTILICLVINSAIAYGAHPLPEKYYQNIWCKENNGITEYKLFEGTRVDCLTDEYAVEFDFAPKWAESIGQSLYYANKTGKSPAIVLIIESNKDFKYYTRIQKLCLDYGIKLSYMRMPKNPENVEIPKSSVENLIDSILNLISAILSQIAKIFS